jgi:plastocyanin
MTGPVSALVLIVATACAGGGGGTASPAASVGAPTRAAPSLAAPTVAASAPAQGCATDSTEGEAVTIVDFSYDPDALTVPAGTAVAWTNNDAGPHTVTFDEGPDCGELNNGDTVALTFDTAGEFSYFCQLHPNMRASITVQ